VKRSAFSRPYRTIFTENFIKLLFNLLFDSGFFISVIYGRTIGYGKDNIAHTLLVGFGFVCCVHIGPPPSFCDYTGSDIEFFS
jgi:hypothetical protein